MTSFLLSAAGFIVWSLSIILMYYSKSYSAVDHIESATGWGGYIVSILVIYGIYKFVTLSFGGKKLSFNLLSIIGIALFHLLILSIVYSGFPEIRQSPFMPAGSISGLTLFTHIITLLAYPILLILLTRSVGYTLAKSIVHEWKHIDMRLRVPAEITLGFIIFTFGLLIIGSLGLYTLTGLIVVLIGMAALGYPGLIASYEDIRRCAFTIENHDMSGNLVRFINLRLLSIEFGFFILTFLFGVALINIIRPMPIGWDDLGVYMNFPKIMATSSQLIEGAGMYAWQLITGTGFLFSYTAAQAFYVNQLGGILAVIAIISTLSYAFEEKGKKSLLSLPVLLAAIYYAMPMTVFQQAKDMKVDPAYLAFSISSIMLLFHVWKGHTDKKKDLSILVIIGLIVGFTFSIKVTSIMLILACLGIIAYRFLSFWGYIGFFFLFLAIFTKLGLWSLMNVPMPKDDPALLTNMSIILGVVGLCSLAFSLWQQKGNDKEHPYEKMSSWLISSAIFGLSVLIGCAPWIIKNIGEIGLKNIPHTSISQLLGGSAKSLVDSYETLYTPEELIQKKEAQAKGMTKDGKSENEDLGRYFGYESGLNNYLKLPANLTFQKNQGGEFTDITYIFLALVPGLLLFVRGRKPYIIVSGFGGFLLFTAVYYFSDTLGGDLSKFFGQFSLIVEPGNWKSYGYILLLAANFGLLAFFHFCTANTEINKKLREVIMFMGIYAFLFGIAAFGIVWYGIIVYFGFFLMMGYSAASFLSEESEEIEKDSENTLHIITLASLLFIFIVVYFIRSAFPHGWNNLRSAYYNEYKYHTLTQEESIFAYRSDYLVPIATMNLQDIGAIYDTIRGEMKSENMKKFFAETDVKSIPLETIHAFIMKYRDDKNLEFRTDIRKLGQHIYSQVLYPPKGNQNMGGIYRIGTFMTYLINENGKRYLEDSLIMTFHDYFYDPSSEKTIERMKKLGIKYLLVDLNAATIDRDPRHALTTRAEELLMTMNAPNLKLVSTDNFCLELALAERKKGKLQTEEAFIDIAGTNYETYRSGATISRGQKLMNCQKYIVAVINEKRSSEYPTIETIEQEVLKNGATQDPTKLQSIIGRYAGQSWFALFEIVDTTPSLSSTSGSINIGGSGALVK